MVKLKQRVRLFRGDCLEILPRLGEGSVDMVMVDPPYGTTQCKWDSIIPLEPMWEELRRVVKGNGAIVITASQPFTSMLGASNITNLRYSWVWQKSLVTGHLNAKRMPLKNHEDVLIFYESQPVYNPQGLQDFNKITKRGGSGKCYGKSGKSNFQEKTNYPRTIQAFKSQSKTVHPTQKPVALMEYLIRTYTNPDNLVLDFAMGSGTTGVACKNLGRRFIGIELDKTYFRMAKKRIGETAWQSP